MSRLQKSNEFHRVDMLKTNYNISKKYDTE